MQGAVRSNIAPERAGREASVSVPNARERGTDDVPSCGSPVVHTSECPVDADGFCNCLHCPIGACVFDAEPWQRMVDLGGEA